MDTTWLDPYTGINNEQLYEDAAGSPAEFVRLLRMQGDVGPPQFQPVEILIPSEPINPLPLT